MDTSESFPRCIEGLLCGGLFEMVSHVFCALRLQKGSFYHHQAIFFFFYFILISRPSSVGITADLEVWRGRCRAVACRWKRSPAAPGSHELLTAPLSCSGCSQPALTDARTQGGHTVERCTSTAAGLRKVTHSGIDPDRIRSIQWSCAGPHRSKLGARSRKLLCGPIFKKH